MPDNLSQSNLSQSNPPSLHDRKTSPRGMLGAKSLDVYGFVPSEIYRRKKRSSPPLSEDEILEWADDHFAHHGKWPNQQSGSIPGTRNETWKRVDSSLRMGTRGLLGNSSLALLLWAQRGRLHRLHLPPYTEKQILVWADTYFERTGKLPVSLSGPIPESRIEENCGDTADSHRISTWAGVDAALTKGARGLPGGSSLVKLLEEHRGKRNRLCLMPLTEAEILVWADAFYESAGDWPILSSGPVCGCPDSSWATLSDALQRGSRGLAGGSSLALLLAEQRGALNTYTLPDFTQEQILAWADAHFARTGNWPTCNSLEPIPECPAENWLKVNSALRLGLRGMSLTNSSLVTFLAEHRGKRHIFRTIRFAEDEILAWADAHFARTGKWPTRQSGPVFEAPEETWGFVGTALSQGVRGLPGGSSLSRLLAEKRDRRNKAALPLLSKETILAWADAHYAQTGHYPSLHCGPIPEAPKETWALVQNALLKGTRGLAGGSSVALLMAEYRGERNLRSLPELTEEQILAWADAHFARTGDWPECHSHGHNPVVDAPGETWDKLNGSLMKGQRGLLGSKTLAQLLRDKRGKRFLKGLPSLTEEQILSWADAYFARTGKWPAASSKEAIREAPGECWNYLSQSLRTGTRGLPGGTSLTLLLAQQRGLRVRARTTPLTLEQIEGWARAHRVRTGTWPRTKSGEVVGGDGTLWAAVDKSLRGGCRGLPGGMTLASLIAPLEEAETTGTCLFSRKAA